MRQESLRHASIPCLPLDDEFYDEPCYKVESTGEVFTLSSSVSLLYFYCSRLPLDGYFKPNPRCVIEKEAGTCTLHLPKTCKEHHVGALTNNLVPDIVEEEAINKELECQIHTVENRNTSTRIGYHCSNDSEAMTWLKYDDEIMAFELDIDRRAHLRVQLNYSKVATLTSEEIRRCHRSQMQGEHQSWGGICSCMLENSVIIELENQLPTENTTKSGMGSTYDLKKNHFLGGGHICKVHNYLQRCRTQKAKDSTDSSVELPPELCSLIMSPVSISTLYT
ncbi:Dicer-like protein 2 [Datura stramonium]|uniref:Dicer-like protein 2 n=1 Tax=Datura stramonium TaxID=4076 RepID=A0ABS8SVL7_DATST|nr:Dicer-like protein 2 [Datura stramonium]